MKNTYERRTGLDLMRLLCMIMIVSLHYCGAGGVSSANNSTFFNKLFSGSIIVFCRVAVNCFWLNSGFFLLKNKEAIIKQYLNSIFPIWVKTFFYSFFIYCIFIVIHFYSFSVRSMIGFLFPVTNGNYWFITAFIAFLVLKPVLQIAYEQMNRRELVLVTIGLLFFDCFQSLWGKNSPLNEFGNGLLHSLTMITIGCLISKLEIKKSSRKLGIIIYVLSCIVTRLSSLIPGVDFYPHFMVYNSILLVTASTGLFVFFLNIDIKSSFFSHISPHVISIYLINDHPLMRQFFWEKVLHCSLYYESNLLILHFIVVVIGFVTLSLVFDYCIFGFLFKGLRKRRMGR